MDDLNEFRPTGEDRDDNSWLNMQMHITDILILYKAVEFHLDKWPGGDRNEQIILMQMKNFLYKSVLEYKFKHVESDGGEDGL